MHDASVPIQWLEADEVSGQLVKAAAEWGNGFWTSTNEWLKRRRWPVGSEPSARALQRPKSGLHTHYAHSGQPQNLEYKTFYLNSRVVIARMHSAQLKFRKFYWASEQVVIIFSHQFHTLHHVQLYQR